MPGQVLRASVLLPVAAFFVLLGCLAIPASRIYLGLRIGARGRDPVVVTSRTFVAVVPASRLPLFALNMAATAAEKPIIAFNIPAHFVDLLLAYLKSRRPLWSPALLTLSSWNALSFPVFAMPAWWFVGRGFDALRFRRRIGKLETILSVTLASLCLILTAVLSFGFSAAERDERWGAYVTGFALWTVLFGIPFATRWVHRTSQNSGVPVME